MQSLGTTKSRNLSGQTKITQPLWTNKNATGLDKKNHALSRDKKNQATSRYKKNHATSWDKKNHVSSWDKKIRPSLGTKKSSNLLKQQTIMLPICPIVFKLVHRAPNC